MTETDYTLARQPRARRRFSILLPVLRPPAMLPFAIRSVLAQSEQDFELCVVCDGAPPETAAAAREFAASDPRVLVFPFPKGERHGEAHRAAVLEGARSDFVAHIGDDDLWLPNHLETLAQLFADADFVTVPQFRIQPGLPLQVGSIADLSRSKWRRKMLNRAWNFFGPTECAYRLSVYRALPEGWAPGPPDIWSDLNMWRKFLSHPGLRYRTGLEITCLKFATPHWKDLSLDERKAANAALWDRLQNPTAVRQLRREARILLARSIEQEDLQKMMTTDPIGFLTIWWRRRLGGPSGNLPPV